MSKIGVSRRWAALAPLLVLASVATAAAQTAPAQPPQQHVKIAFVQVDGDPRYTPIQATDRIVLKAPAHPFAGAQVGVDEAAPLVRILDADFALDRITVKSPADVAPAIQQAASESYRPLAAVMHSRDIIAATPDWRPA